MTNLQSDRQEVSRLKELLFKEERRTLSNIERVVAEHDRRIGDDEALQHSVAEILSDALREADVRNHRELAASISPVVVAGIKREIVNSRDEMVDALYPILGRLVAAYVANAFREFVEETNRRLENGLTGRYLRLRLKSLFTGGSYQQLVLQEARGPRIAELLLVRKHSGVLLDHWRADPRQGADPLEPDEYLLSSLLTAINDFAAEAFARENHELRSLDIGDGRIYLRSSPAHLVAVKCAGQASRRFEKSLDRALIDSLERHEAVLAQVEAGGKTKLLNAMLPELAEDLNLALAQEKRAPVLAIALFSFLAVAGAGWLAWSYRDAYLTAELRDRARDAVSASAGLRGFPIEVKAAPDRGMVTLTGLAPSPEAAASVTASVREAVKPASVEARLASVPASERLDAVEARLQAFAESAESRMDGLAARDEVAAQAEKLAALARGAATAEQVNRIAAELDARLGGIAARLDDPDYKLREWVQSHAIFFGDDANFRDAEAAGALLKELYALLGPSKAKLRILGYTDPTGTKEGNDALAAQRADKVMRELVQMGAPRERLKVLGRPKGAMLSYDKGPNSSNRRVEFELAYSEEPIEITGEPLKNNASRPEGHAPR